MLVDTSVLLDVATSDPTWGWWSQDALARAADSAVLVINPIIYAEVSVSFTRIEDLESSLPPELYHRADLPWEAAFLAGKAFLRYRRQGGLKRAPMPDFYIGAHAAVAGLRLLTRDAGRVRSYFPTVELLTP